MPTLHTFGCSITQGFALPDVVRPILNSQGQPLTPEEIQAQGIEVQWEDIHILAPSQYAWPSILAQQLNVPVVNHARRGACTQQISRQCAVAAASIKPDDLVIVMWTYLSRISLQWPARTSVPLATVVDPSLGWRTKFLPLWNRFFGLSNSNNHTTHTDEHILKYIHDSTRYTYLDPLGVYDRYYNSLVLQVMTDGFLRSTGARVIHLSVEPESYTQQLEQARSQLDPSLREPYVIPDPSTWYSIPVDHSSCLVIHDPSIPPAENDMHPSVLHHSNFAQHLYELYFKFV